MESLCASSPTNVIECFMACLLGCGSVFWNFWVPKYNPRCKGQVTFFYCQPLCLNIRMIRAYKYRLWTNRNQKRELGIMLETHRRLYNACLEQRKTALETDKRSIGYGEQFSWYKSKRETNPYFACLNFSSARVTMRRLDKAFTAFFRRIKTGVKLGYPCFKNPIGFPV